MPTSAVDVPSYTDLQKTTRLLRFAKTTLIGGIVFLAPVVVLALVTAKALGVFRRIAEPVARHIPVSSVLGVLAADVVVMLLLILACFLAGLLARVSIAERFVHKAEANLLWRLPGYGFVKSLTASLDRSAAASSMIPVLIHLDDADQLAFEVDRLSDGRRVVYVPNAPDPRTGAILVLSAERVEPVPTTFFRAFGVYRTLGRGMGRALGPPLSSPTDSPT